MTRFFDSTTIDEVDDCAAVAELAHPDCADVLVARGQNETDAFARDYAADRQVVPYAVGLV
ncbi:hypothetical protein DEM27_15460 [Metarhizobium album]|uniref:Uncharacterized protein n=1 Tax=Metarhizobium album TaxID=2182425 RepID=A0A2U2DQ66_9HYPH|nr:hypothetical protein [Rhizobium album]PWE55450.1 hypothetical protein DEM27_15460 [Rhizobium album]